MCTVLCTVLIVTCTVLHLLYHTSLILAGSAFPGVADLLHGIEELGPEEKGKRIKELRKGFNLELWVTVASIVLTLVALTTV